jgi:hypothetical protein
MLDTALLLLFHCFGWFIFAAFMTIIHRKSGTMQLSTASALGVISFILHVIARHFNWISF